MAKDHFRSRHSRAGKMRFLMNKGVNPFKLDINQQETKLAKLQNNYDPSSNELTNEMQLQAKLAEILNELPKDDKLRNSLDETSENKETHNLQRTQLGLRNGKLRLNQ